MDEKRRRIVFVAGAIFVALIFLSSYAAFNNNNVVSSSTTTATAQPTFYTTGNTNAIITNYSSLVNIALLNNSNAVNNKVINIISQLQANGIIQNYVFSNNSYQVVLSGLSAYNLQQLLYNKTGSSNYTSVGATTYVTLPNQVTLNYTTQSITINLANRNYSVYMKRVKKIGAIINVSVSALLTRDGNIYKNQFKISYSG
jgi:hypothetical protein